MKKVAYFTGISFLITLLIACADTTKKEKPTLDTNKEEIKELATVKEDIFDLRNDSIIFNSATIENFDKDGNSQTVFWLDAKKDTILRFYRKYDANKKLIGAEYYEVGDIEPSRDTVYTNSEGKKVEASLREGKISWKSTITTDKNGNPVLKTYENSKGEYRGIDSLYFDDQNREIKGFYENSKGKRYGIKTYKYTKSDENGNWMERNMFVNDTLRQKHVRMLQYHE
ncbi:hypothetical protein KORDIASMS9_00474 [Kordia sp. SMS9]|uniref:hypothetical protein n=1 Tax=Kordia sp. SMS9 TaxID=2282170 RepID=UPI000E0CE3BD|nr:hypothetical protein [Kordia sp. SMS9]AXG68281.1 hypothetical protein KORDIASMS9_00474 [Kordia sp. SMS9]